MSNRESFKSNLGFILVSAGCAIGIGNVWKFPYVAGQNGGGLFVIYLTLVAGVGQSPAQAINLVFFISAAAAALPYHLRTRKLNLKIIFLCVPLGILGTFLGGILRESLDESMVRSAFGIMLILTGGYSLLKRRKSEKTLKKQD